MVIFRRRVEPVAGVLILLTLAASVAAAIAARNGVDLYARLALVPALVWHGEVWRLLTWPLVEGGPAAVVFTCITIFWFGGDLEGIWGSRPFARYAASVMLAAGALTSIAGLFSFDVWAHFYLGSWALGDALVIAWALAFPERRIRIYMFLVVGGPTLAYGTFAFIVLCAAFYGVAPMLPMVIAGGLALAHATGGLPRWWRRRMRVVRGGKPSEPPHGPYYTN